MIFKEIIGVHKDEKQDSKIADFDKRKERRDSTNKEG